MSGRRRFFSEDWASIAKFRIALDPRITVSRHRYRGEAWYALTDPLSGRVFRLNRAAYHFVARLDGTQNVAVIWKALVETYGDAAPSQEQVLSLLGQLSQADFIQNRGVSPVLAQIEERRRKRASSLFKRNALGPLSFRIPLYDPDALLARITPAFRPLIGRFGLMLWLTLVGLALVLAGVHWQALAENLPDQIFSAQNLATYVAAYVVIKLIHEVAHGVVAKHYGAPIHEVGIMFLVLFPVPYVDGWATAGFRNKWQRAGVALAGIIAETSIAAIAMFVWVGSDPGPLRGLAYDVMLVAGVSTVFVNANPLLKFDGYFALTDILESPNLAQRSNQFWGRLVETHAFGLEQESPARLGPGERWLALIYAPAAFVYRVFLSITIALMVASQYLFLGAILALWSLTMSLIVPACKALWKVGAGARLHPKRSRAVAVTGASIALGAGLLLAIPVPSHTVVQGLAVLPETAIIRAESDGFAAPVAADGATGPFLKLADPILEARVASFEAQLREAELKLASYRGVDPVLYRLTEAEVEDASERLSVASLRLEGLTVPMPIAGTPRFAQPAQDLPGRYLRRGEVVGWGLPETRDLVRAVVPQRAIARVRDDLQSLSVLPISSNAQPLNAMLIRAAAGGSFVLPDPAFALQNGGSIAADLTDTSGVRALERVFVMDLRVQNSAPLWPGMRLDVRITHSPEPLGQQLFRHLRYLVFRDLGV